MLSICDLKEIYIKQHYLKIGILCSLVPPQFCAPLLHMQTTNKTYCVIIMICVENVSTYPNACSPSLKLRAETSDGGVEWLTQRHHSPYYNTLYQQHDFEAVILRLEKKKKLHNVALKCKTTAMLNLFSCRFILSRTDARKLLLSHVANLFYNRSQWLIHCVMHYIMHRYRTQIFTWFIYSRCRLKSFCSLRAE